MNISGPSSIQVNFEFGQGFEPNAATLITKSIRWRFNNFFKEIKIKLKIWKVIISGGTVILYGSFQHQSA